VALLIEINLAVLHAENAKFRQTVTHAHARQDVVYKVRV
jgi:hypothetical protein